MVLLAAAASGKPAIDAVFLDIEDDNGLAKKLITRRFRASRLRLASTRPKYVVRQASRPSEDEANWATRVLAEAVDDGVSLVGGQMIDGPLLAQARRIMGKSPSNPARS